MRLQVEHDDNFGFEGIRQLGREGGHGATFNSKTLFKNSFYSNIKKDLTTSQQSLRKLMEFFPFISSLYGRSLKRK